MRPRAIGRLAVGGSRGTPIGISSDSLDVCWIGNGYCLGMLVLDVMLFSMDLFMLFEILRTLEGLLANLANVWLQGCVNYEAASAAADEFKRQARFTSKMTGNVVALCTSSIAVDPFASQTEVIGRLSTNVVVAEMVIESLGVSVGESTVLPETFVL